MFFYKFQKFLFNLILNLRKWKSNWRAKTHKNVHTQQISCRPSEGRVAHVCPLSLKIMRLLLPLSSCKTPPLTATKINYEKQFVLLSVIFLMCCQPPNRKRAKRVLWHSDAALVSAVSCTPEMFGPLHTSHHHYACLHMETLLDDLAEAPCVQENHRPSFSHHLFECLHLCFSCSDGSKPTNVCTNVQSTNKQSTILTEDNLKGWLQQSIMQLTKLHKLSHLHIRTIILLDYTPARP